MSHVKYILRISLPIIMGISMITISQASGVVSQDILSRAQAEFEHEKEEIIQKIQKKEISREEWKKRIDEQKREIIEKAKASVRAESNKQNEQQKNEIKSKIRKQLVSIESLSEKKRINRYRQALQKVELMLQSQKLSQKEVLILRLTKEVIQEQLASKKGVK